MAIQEHEWPVELSVQCLECKRVHSVLIDRGDDEADESTSGE